MSLAGPTAILPFILAIGASSGGPRALAEILGHLPRDFPGAILVAQHTNLEGGRELATWLGEQSVLPVGLALAGQKPKPGRVFLARGGDHLYLSPELTLEYTPAPRDTPYRPSVDALFLSLAQNASSPGVGVLLTGMGRDGAQGLLALRRAGWTTMAQDQDSSEIYGMPKAAAQLRAAQLTLPLSAMASTLALLVVNND